MSGEHAGTMVAVRPAGVSGGSGGVSGGGGGGERIGDGGGGKTYEFSRPTRTTSNFLV